MDRSGGPVRATGIQAKDAAQTAAGARVVRPRSQALRAGIVVAVLAASLGLAFAAVVAAQPGDGPDATRPAATGAAAAAPASSSRPSQGSGAAAAAPDTLAEQDQARPPAASGQSGTVRKVIDGDTLEVRIAGKNTRVRLVQIDAPEMRGTPECWGDEAGAALARLVPVGATVTLYADPTLDRTDGFGRALRYVFRDKTNVNVLMVSRGDAAPYFYRGERGRYAAGLERAALGAKKARLGLWGACPGTVYAPMRGVDTGPPR